MDVHKKTFGIFDIGIRITQKWCAIAHENRLNEAYARFGAHLTLQMAGQSVMANCMHRQGLDGRPRKNLAFFTSESGSPKKWCSIAHENHQNEAYALLRGSFDPPNGSDKP